MRTFFRWFPIWLLSSACVIVGFDNARYYADAPPPEPWEHEYWDAQAGCYVLGLVIFWIQLAVWCYCNPTPSRIWFVVLGAAFIASIAAFVVGVISAGPMFL